MKKLASETEQKKTLEERSQEIEEQLKKKIEYLTKQNRKLNSDTVSLKKKFNESLEVIETISVKNNDFGQSRINTLANSHAEEGIKSVKSFNAPPRVETLPNTNTNFRNNSAAFYRSEDGSLLGESRSRLPSNNAIFNENQQKSTGFKNDISGFGSSIGVEKDYFNSKQVFGTQNISRGSRNSQIGGSSDGGESQHTDDQSPSINRQSHPSRRRNLIRKRGNLLIHVTLYTPSMKEF